MYLVRTTGNFSNRSHRGVHRIGSPDAQLAKIICQFLCRVHSKTISCGSQYLAASKYQRCRLSNRRRRGRGLRLGAPDQEPQHEHNFSEEGGLRIAIGIETTINITMSKACRRLTPLSRSYKASATKIKPACPMSSPAMPRRKSVSDAAMLLAVAVAFPWTISLLGI